MTRDSTDTALAIPLRAGHARPVRYRDEFGDLEEGTEGYDSAVEKADSNNLLGCWNPMPHRGLQDTSVFEQLRYAARRMILENYVGILLPRKPISRRTPNNCERN